MRHGLLGNYGHDAEKVNSAIQYEKVHSCYVLAWRCYNPGHIGFCCILLHGSRLLWTPFNNVRLKGNKGQKGQKGREVQTVGHSRHLENLNLT